MGAVSWPQGRKKDANGVFVRLFPVVGAVLSIFSLTYMDLLLNSKTVPVFCQCYANYLPSNKVGKNSSRTLMLSWAV